METSMIIKYFYDKKLAQASYLVGCGTSAMVIDPSRDITPYIQVAQDEGLDIKIVTETHIHADFVSGIRELAFATGADMYLSDMGTEDWKYQFTDDNIKLLKDGDRFQLNDVAVDVIHTPGHTPEHIVFMITDTEITDEPVGIFSGDFIFAGTVGRPDLLETAAGIANTAVTGARQQFQNIQRFKDMPDYLHIWPGHSAGSACGKSLGAVPSTILGYEKIVNPAFQIESEDEFVEWILEDQPETPLYFGQMKKVNKVGPALLLEIGQAQHILEHPDGIVPEGSLFIDTRSPEIYARKHLTGTVNIPITSTGFATYTGWYMDYEQPVFFIAYQSDVQEVLTTLYSIGVDHIAGYFTPDVLKNESDTIAQISPQEAHDKGYHILDVRATSEWNDGHIPNAQHIPMGYVLDQKDSIPDDKPVVVHCAGATRSQVVISLLNNVGFQNLINLSGGFSAWERDGLPTETDEEE
jgi:hydroxyacylglutathione hydrolase